MIGISSGALNTLVNRASASAIHEGIRFEAVWVLDGGNGWFFAVDAVNIALDDGVFGGPEMLGGRRALDVDCGLDPEISMGGGNWSEGTSLGCSSLTCR
jgi:hypothetical protein